MQKDVKTMKNKITKGTAYVSRNLRYGGLALTLTAAFIATARPSRIIVLLTPYSGDLLVLSGVLVLMGVLSSMLGYAIKR